VYDKFETTFTHLESMKHKIVSPNVNGSKVAEEIVQPEKGFIKMESSGSFATSSPIVIVNLNFLNDQTINYKKSQF